MMVLTAAVLVFVVFHRFSWMFMFMASMMGICAGLVGPKSENVDFSLVFQAFLKGSRERGSQDRV